MEHNNLSENQSPVLALLPKPTGAYNWDLASTSQASPILEEEENTFCNTRDVEDFNRFTQSQPVPDKDDWTDRKYIPVDSIYSAQINY